MATNQTHSSADQQRDPLLEKLGAIPAAQTEVFAYSVKIVCGRQTETNCCCVAGARPGVYGTEVNIQNTNIVPATVVKLVVPLINSGARRTPKRRYRAHHRHPDDREPSRAVRLRCLHGEPSER